MMTLRGKIHPSSVTVLTPSSSNALRADARLTVTVRSQQMWYNSYLAPIRCLVATDELIEPLLPPQYRQEFYLAEHPTEG